MKTPIKNNLLIELWVPSFEVAKNFYIKLGFEVASEDPKGVFPAGYLVMRRNDRLGTTLINLYGDEPSYQQSYFKKFSPDTPRGYGASIVIPVTHIQDIYEQAGKELPSHIVRELQQKNDAPSPYLDFRMVDPFGFYLRFTELVDWGQ